MAISAASAETLTASLEEIEAHAVGLAAALEAYDQTFNGELRRAWSQDGWNGQQLLEQGFGPRRRDFALAARLRALGVVGLFAAMRATGRAGEDWAADMAANIKAAAKAEAA